jgi:hypothetical protein
MGRELSRNTRPVFALVGLLSLLWVGCGQPGPPRGPIPNKDAAKELRRELAEERAVNIEDID